MNQSYTSFIQVMENRVAHLWYKKTLVKTYWKQEKIYGEAAVVDNIASKKWSFFPEFHMITRKMATETISTGKMSTRKS